ncbi:MAG: type II/IV secretion system protein [Gammaproteobacteria bacterium]|nr:MAG: type II/IV secretion system protein [Gammaproteobacteria bacterium]RLA14078.1 MAG: type II/IV secretion system protein [Gammaproteobacteria bacterium]
MRPPVHQGKLQLRQVLQWLVEDGLITAKSAQALSAGGSQEHPLLVIARQNWKSVGKPHSPLSAERLTEWLAKRVDLEYFRIDPLKLDLRSITGVVSFAYASRFQIMPLRADDDTITVAVSEPFVSDWLDTITHVSKKNVVRVFANPLEINRYLNQLFKLNESIDSAADDRNKISAIGNFEQLIELGASARDGEDQHIVNIVDWLLQYAFDQRASDIHLEPRRGEGMLRFRIDGVLHLVHSVPDNVMSGILSRLKILGRMDVSEKRRPQDGRVKTRSPGGQEVELRASTIPTAFGEKMVLRIFDPDTVIKGFGELGFDKSETQRWNELIANPNGIILVSGPTGSGKTTTLYSTLKQLAKPTLNVCTIEDPIEMIEAAFNQTQVQPNAGLSFADGVRTLMRQDPDIIMVGEIRDHETADVAIQAALTGHLVLTTIHTNDAPSSLSRLMELGVPPYLLEATVLGVLAQRLVRTLCPHCKQEEPVDEVLWKNLVRPIKFGPPAKVFAPVGCDECRGTGFLGRVGIYEMMMIDPQIRSLIDKDLNLRSLQRAALIGGMVPLRVAGARKVAAGLTTLGEVMRVVPPPQEDPLLQPAPA